MPETRSLEDMIDAANATPPSAQPAQPDPSHAAEAEHVDTTGEQQDQAPAAAAAEPARGAPPAPSEQPNGMVPRSALEDERRKRQDRDREIDDLNRRFRDLERRVTQPAQTTEKPARPDPLVDPEGFAAHIAKEQLAGRIESSREDMIDEVGADKFSAAEAAFFDAAKADPLLVQRLRTSFHPAKFAYQHGTRLLEQRAQAPDAESTLLAKLRAQLEQEYQLVPRSPAAAPASQPAPAVAASAPAVPAAARPAAPPRPALPTSLAAMPSAGPRKAADKHVPTRSMEELYGE